MHRRKELAWRIRLVLCSCFEIETLRSKSGWVIHSLSDLQLCYICGQFAHFWFHVNIVQWFRTSFFLLCSSTGILGGLTYLLCQLWAQLPQPGSLGF